MEDFLDLDVRRNIYDLIAKYPGLHFREIQRRTNLATGSLDYHLHFLHRHGLIRIEKDRKFVRYYAAGTGMPEQKELLSLLRQGHVRHILIYLMQEKNPTARMVSDAVGISPSNLSWYLKILQEHNLVTQRKKGRFRFYKISREFRDSIIKCLVTYRESFLDKIVDNFIDAWTGD